VGVTHHRVHTVLGLSSAGFSTNNTSIRPPRPLSYASLNSSPLAADTSPAPMNHPASSSDSVPTSAGGTPAYRIIDANFNRAREALRTIDDIARFWLQSPGICERAKLLRHRLAAAAASLPGGEFARMSNRDLSTDVGVNITTAQERNRPSLRDVVGPACGRLSESLRSLEEAAKTLPGGAPMAALIESIRYDSYSLEKVLVLRLGPASVPQWRLCVLITESLCALPWLDVARAAIDAGADCLQLREKSLDGREILTRAIALRRLTHPGVSIIINDRADIALAAGADGVHVGQSDLPVAAIRRLAGQPLFIGVSTENLEQAAAAWEAGADYCGVGPMFATTTKHKSVIAGPTYMQAYANASAPRPHLAIGGITPLNISQLVLHGCRGIAVLSSVCGSSDPGGVCRSLLALLSPTPAIIKQSSLEAHT